MADQGNGPPAASQSAAPDEEQRAEEETGTSFFHRHEKTISGLSSIGSVIGVIFGFIALSITAIQAIEAKRLIHGSTIFQINKEARELVASIHSDPDVAAIILEKEGDELKPTRAAMDKAGNMIWTMVQFYETVHEQQKLGMLPAGTWKNHSSSVCTFFRQKNVRRWVENVGYVKNASADAEFIRFVVVCLNQ